MPKAVTVAVIGAGNMGRNHLRNYSELAGAELLGVADLNPAVKEMADEYGCAFFTDYKKMLDELKPEAVSIVVPTPFHAEVAEEAMNRGIHVLLEKPIASTVKEGEFLIKLARRKGLVFTVGHIERYNPVVRKLKELVSGGSLGEISSIVCTRVGGFPRVEPKTDVIIDLAVHDIDIINYLLGEYPQKISAHGSRTYHSNKIDSAEILMEYKKASGFIHSNWLTPVKVRTISITGSQGYVEANYITQKITYYEHNAFESKDFDEFVKNLGEPKVRVSRPKPIEPLRRELQTFLDTISGKTRGALVDPNDANIALDVALKAAQKYNS